MKNLIAAMSASPDGFTLINHKGFITSWNYAMEKITGLKSISVLNKPIWEVQSSLFPDLYSTDSYITNAKSFWAADKNVALTKLWPNSAEGILNRVDGKILPVGIHYHFFAKNRSLFSPTAKIFLSITLRDLSSQKENEARLEHMANSTFHDLRSPLNAIIGFSDVIIEDIDLLTKNLIIDYAGLIRGGGRHLYNIIENSLLFDKIEKGDFYLEKNPVELKDFLENIRHAFTQIGRHHEISLDTIYSVSNPKHFPAHETLFRSVLENLLKNAAEASPAHKKIVLKVSSDTNFIKFEIRNEGKIPEDLREKLFQKFSTSGKKNGTGLGLYKAKLIVEAHRGKIFCATNGDTTTFTVQLPL